MRNSVAKKIADQVHEWGHRGLIDDDLLTLLTRRYSADITMGKVLLRWLGFIALWMLATSLLGVLSLALGDLAVHLASFVLGTLAYGLWRKGTQMATDEEQRYPTTGAVLVTLGLIAALTALSILPGGLASTTWLAISVRMLLVAAAALYTAYRYGLRWPLTLGVLLLFHALGNLHGYGGRGAYFLWIGNEVVTFGVAVVAVAFGVWHERAIEDGSNYVGFGQIYIVFGLLYANVSLWSLSLFRLDLELVLLATGASIAQIVLGGRLHDGRFTGFGVVFLSIHLYTRLFEHFWNEASKGTLFLVAGVSAMAVGAALESRARRLRVASQ